MPGSPRRPQPSRKKRERGRRGRIPSPLRLGRGRGKRRGCWLAGEMAPRWWSSSSLWLPTPPARHRPPPMRSPPPSKNSCPRRPLLGLSWRGAGRRGDPQHEMRVGLGREMTDLSPAPLRSSASPLPQRRILGQGGRIKPPPLPPERRRNILVRRGEGRGRKRCWCPQLGRRGEGGARRRGKRRRRKMLPLPRPSWGAMRGGRRWVVGQEAPVETRASLLPLLPRSRAPPLHLGRPTRVGRCGGGPHSMAVGVLVGWG